MKKEEEREDKWSQVLLERRKATKASAKQWSGARRGTKQKKARKRDVRSTKQL